LLNRENGLDFKPGEAFHWSPNLSTGMLVTEYAERLAYWLLKRVNSGIRRYAMIGDGERVAVAVSGGKDSLTLLRLDWRRRQSREKYELLAIHIVGDARGRDTPEHPPLRAWLEAEGYDYVLEPTHLAEGEAPTPCPASAAPGTAAATCSRSPDATAAVSSPKVTTPTTWPKPRCST